MHLFHNPQCTIQKRNVHISVLNSALWDMEQMHRGICEVILLYRRLYTISCKFGYIPYRNNSTKFFHSLISLHGSIWWDFNILTSGAAYMHQWSGTLLFQAMACQRFRPKLVLTKLQLNTSVKLQSKCIFYFQNFILIRHPEIQFHFVLASVR